MRSYQGYSINNRQQTFNSSYYGVNRDIEQQTILLVFKVLLFVLYIDKDTHLLPLHLNDVRSCYCQTIDIGGQKPNSSTLTGALSACLLIMMNTYMEHFKPVNFPCT